MAGLTDAERAVLIDGWLAEPWRVMHGGCDPSDNVIAALLSEVRQLRAELDKLSDYMHATDAVSEACADGRESLVDCAIAGWEAMTRLAAVALPDQIALLKAANARLRADLRAAAERIARQSELLSKRAEKAPGLRQDAAGGGGEGCGP